MAAKKTKAKAGHRIFMSQGCDIVAILVNSPTADLEFESDRELHVTIAGSDILVRPRLPSDTKVLTGAAKPA